MKDKLKMVKLADIIVDERYRVDLGNIDELKESINEKGILQPITLSSDLHLLAGGRRYTACMALGLVEIPALLRVIEGEIDAREIELIENIHRKEFTWQEQAKLIARIHTLYSERNINWTGRKTAELIDKNPMNVSRALRLAAGMEVLPSLEQCKTADEASTVIKKAEEDSIVQELARRQKGKMEQHENNPASTQKEKGLAATLRCASENYVIGDAIKHIEHMKANINFNLIDCDPPLELANEKLASELYRVAAKDSWLLYWFPHERYIETYSDLLKAGWKIDPAPFVWYQNAGTVIKDPTRLSHNHTTMFVCHKGNVKLARQGSMNTILCAEDRPSYHPQQHPIYLMKALLQTFLEDMQFVFVPFCGSGVTLRACYELGFQCLGIENNPEYKPKFLLTVEEDTKKILAKQ
ncbi:MAG: ParB/RepB/Spo0J family partition protein [Pseudomonadota bacterium]|nr:ParB/RepB/Spo0J family partition protein [Pseudomonadota bacterium]